MGDGDQLSSSGSGQCSGAPGAASSCARTSSGSSPSSSPPQRRPGAGDARSAFAAWAGRPGLRRRVRARPGSGSRSGSTTTPGAPRGASSTSRTCPFFDSLSFTFLAYASLGLAGAPRRRARGGSARPARAFAWLAWRVLMMLLDVVIDPLAVRGDRWFLGRIFYYRSPAGTSGCRCRTSSGWVLVGAAIGVGLDRPRSWRVGGARPAWGTRWPGADASRGLYYLVLASTWR